MIDGIARRAVLRAIGRLEDAARTDLPSDVTVLATGDGLRLTGPDLRHRWITDVRLRGLSIAARMP